MDQRDQELKAFADNFGIKRGWHFLTGARTEIAATAVLVEGLKRMARAPAARA
jgi:hypothetical protein